MKLTFCFVTLVASQAVSTTVAGCTDPCWQYPDNENDCKYDSSGNRRWEQTPGGSWKRCNYYYSSYYANNYREGNKCYSEDYFYGGYPTECPGPTPTQAPTAAPLSRAEEIAAIGGLPLVRNHQDFY